VPRYFTHIIERSDPELLVLETDRCLFEDPKFKCVPQNFRIFLLYSKGCWGLLPVLKSLFEDSRSKCAPPPAPQSAMCSDAASQA